VTVIKRVDLYTVVYQNGGLTPAWSVSQWWLAGRGAVTHGLGGHSLAAAVHITGGRTQPSHPANHHCDTLQA